MTIDEAITAIINEAMSACHLDHGDPVSELEPSVIRGVVEQLARDTLEAHANAICIERNQDTDTDIEVVRRRQRDGSSLWRVKRLSSVLMRDGTWEFEPQPSSREDDWIRRASYPTAAEATKAYYLALTSLTR